MTCRIPVMAADSGCWVDGHWGWQGSLRVIQLAHEFGWQMYPNVHPDDEFVHEIADMAEQYMNDHVAPDGHAFGWFDGEWFLWPYETWEESA